MPSALAGEFLSNYSEKVQNSIMALAVIPLAYFYLKEKKGVELKEIK